MRRELEPLYRYLKTVQREPVTQLILDMEELARDGYIVSRGSTGLVAVRETLAHEDGVSAIMASYLPSINNYHMSFQYVGKTLFASLTSVNAAANLTALAFVVEENDLVSVNYLRDSEIRAIRGRTIKSSSFATVALEDGETTSGMVNIETTFIADPSGYDTIIKCDFKLSRAKPFYIRITTDAEGTKGRVVDESEYQTMGEQWRA